MLLARSSCSACMPCSGACRSWQRQPGVGERARGAQASGARATTLVIDGAGDGHGVGMSQDGALGFAEHGWTYTAILAHYYTGTALGAGTGEHDREGVGRLEGQETFRLKHTCAGSSRRRCRPAGRWRRSRHRPSPAAPMRSPLTRAARSSTCTPTTARRCTSARPRKHLAPTRPSPPRPGRSSPMPGSPRSLISSPAPAGRPRACRTPFPGLNPSLGW